MNRGCYSVDVSSGECTTIFEAAGERGVLGGKAWSPDGKAIYYSVRNLANWHGSVVRRDRETGLERALYSLSSFHNPIRLAVSPDGTKLAFALTFVKVGDQLQPHTVMVVPTGGGEAREIARIEPPNRIVDDTVAWTPDGRFVVFGIAQGPERVQLWKVSPSGGAPARLFAIDMAWAWNFRLHPDGTRLAFTSSQPASEIWVMENFQPAPAGQKRGGK